MSDLKQNKELSKDEITKIMNEMLKIRKNNPIGWRSNSEYADYSSILNNQIQNFPSSFTNERVTGFIYKLSTEDFKKLLIQRLNIARNNPSAWKTNDDYIMITNILNIQVQNYPSVYTEDVVKNLALDAQNESKTLSITFDTESLTRIYLDIMKNDYLMVNETTDIVKSELNNKILERINLLRDPKITSISSEMKASCYNEAVFRFLIFIQREINSDQYILDNIQTKLPSLLDLSTLSLYETIQKQTDARQKIRKNYFDNIVKKNTVFLTLSVLDDIARKANDTNYLIQEFY